MDPKQCTIWPSLWHKSLRSRRKIQYWSSSSIFVSRSNRILDWNYERYWQICQRSHADPRGRESFWETRCKSETTIKTVINKWLGLCSYWAKTMDWHWNTGIQGSLWFSSVKIHHSITSTEPTSLSRRRWRSPSRPSYWWMQEKAIRQYRMLVRRDERFRQCSALAKWQMDISSGKRWRTVEKVTILLESELSSSIPVPSSNSGTFRKYYQSCIARQCTFTRRFYREYYSTSNRFTHSQKMFWPLITFRCNKTIPNQLINGVTAIGAKRKLTERHSLVN